MARAIKSYIVTTYRRVGRMNLYSLWIAFVIFANIAAITVGIYAVIGRGLFGRREPRR